MYSGARVKLLSFYRSDFGRSAESWTKEEKTERIKWETYDGDLSLDNSVVVSGVAYRLENFVQSSFGGSPGGHGCMERAKGDEKKRYAFELTTRFSIYCTQTTIWPCLRSGTSKERQQRKYDKTQRNFGTIY